MYASEVYTNTTNLQISVGKPEDQRFNPVFTINNDNRLVLQQVQVSDASSLRRGGEGVCGTSYRGEGRVWYFIPAWVLHTGGGRGGVLHTGREEREEREGRVWSSYQGRGWCCIPGVSGAKMPREWAEKVRNKQYSKTPPRS